MIVGDTQQRLLAKLLEAKAGLTVDELAGAVDITRSAVKQHLSGMERSGYVQHTSSKSGGRPRFLYTLTESGIDLYRHIARANNVPASLQESSVNAGPTMA